MNISKKQRFLIDIFTFAYSFIRVIGFSTSMQVGVVLLGSAAKFRLPNLIFWIVTVLFSLATSLLIHEFLKRCNYSASVLLIFLLADPLFLAMNQYSALLIICALCFIFVWNDIREKAFLNRDFLFLIFVIITLIIYPDAILSFVPVLIVLYILPLFSNTEQKLKPAIMLTTTIIGIAVGFGTNKILSANIESFDQMLSSLCITPDKFKDDTYIFYILAVVAIIINILAFAPIFGIKESKHDKSGFSSIATISQISIAASFISSFFFGSETLYAVGIITPLIFITLACRKSAEVQNIVNIINDKVQKHSVIASVGFMVILYICLYVLMYYNPSYIAVVVLVG